VLPIKFSAGRKFSSPKSPTSCSCKPLKASLKTQRLPKGLTTHSDKKIGAETNQKTGDTENP